MWALAIWDSKGSTISVRCSTAYSVFPRRRRSKGKIPKKKKKKKKQKKKDKKSTKDGGVSKTTGKIYAVKKGRKTGLYTCCDAATAQVSGYKGGQMKRFNSRAEAQRYLNGTL